MSCPTQTFHGITPPVHERLVNAAAAKGFAFPATDKGSVTVSGCAFDWRWERDSHTLTVTCTSKPFYVSCDAVWDHISDLLKEVREQPCS